MLRNPSNSGLFLVSGGSGGIGAAVCESLAQHGFKPLVAYHSNRFAARDLAERCQGTALQLDLTAESSIQETVAYIEAQQEPLAGVVLCGSPPLVLAPFTRVTSEELQLQLQVNVIGPQRLLAELVRRCFRKQKAGTVIGVLTQAMGNMHSAEHGEGVASGMGAYVIAKYGMAGMLEILAADYPWLRVRSVRPGYTETPMLQAFDERFLALQREKQQFMTPQQVASLIVEEAIHNE